MITQSNPLGVDPKRFYSVTEAAALLGIHRSTLWRWVNVLKIRFRTRKVNNRKEFAGSDIIKLFQHL